MLKKWFHLWVFFDNILNIFSTYLYLFHPIGNWVLIKIEIYYLVFRKKCRKFWLSILRRSLVAETDLKITSCVYPCIFFKIQIIFKGSRNIEQELKTYKLFKKVIVTKKDIDYKRFIVKKMY